MHGNDVMLNDGKLLGLLDRPLSRAVSTVKSSDSDTLPNVQGLMAHCGREMDAGHAYRTRLQHPGLTCLLNTATRRLQSDAKSREITFSGLYM